VDALPVSLELASVAAALPPGLVPKELARWGHWPALDSVSVAASEGIAC
jgi:hypothetical protein